MNIVQLRGSVAPFVRCSLKQMVAIEHHSKNIPHFLIENHEKGFSAIQKTPFHIFGLLPSSLTNGRKISKTHFLIEFSILKVDFR